LIQGRLWRAIKKPYFWIHVIVAVAVLIGVVIGGGIAGIPRAWRFVPDFENAASDLWAALLAGLFGAFFVKTTKRNPDLSQVIATASRRLGPDLTDHSHRTALQHRADPLLVEAIMIAESLQRPRWFRRLENRFGPMLGAQSYGVMQLPNSRPMSDAESITKAVEGYFRGIAIDKDEYGTPDINAVRNAAIGYNPSGTYGDLVVEIYLYLLQRQ
jgi:hypothetical protein